MKKINKELDQDRIFDLVDTFRQYNYCMFPQQRAIYRQLADKSCGTVLEAGCGIGLGSAMIDQRMTVDGKGDFMATDKLERNVKFAKELYPWIDFEVWDINFPYIGNKRDVVVCVETLEHVADPASALNNLMDAAEEEVWITTPNGNGKPQPPENPYHVTEYPIRDMIQMIGNISGRMKLTVHGWEDFIEVPYDSEISPVAYRIQKQ